MTQEELVVAIRVTAENAEQTIQSIRDSCEELGATVDKVGGAGQNAFGPLKDNAQQAAAAQATLAGIAATTFATITKAVQGGTSAYNEYTAAVKGLQSVASGKGINQQALAKSLDTVTDEFLNASEAATAYKNLLTRGFSLEQATTTIERLKDAATFGRAANLTLAEAVVSATEGLRQENSVLVDNAGVTKNVAKMWEEYAKARGLTTASLTQSQKVEAEYLGIIQETQLQVGDLAKASDTLAGAQAANAAAAKETAAAYGDAMAPAVKTVTDVSTGMLKTLDGIVSAAPGLTAGLTAAAAAMALYVTAAKGAAAAQALIAAGSGLISGPMLAVGAAVGVVVTAYTAYAKAQEEAAKAQEEAARAAEEERRAQQQKAQDLTAQAGELGRLADEYKRLTDMESRSALENERLETLIGMLVTQYGISEEALRGLAGAYDSGNDAIEDRIRMYEQEILAIKAVQEEQAAAAAAAKQAELDRMKQVAQGVAGKGQLDLSELEGAGVADPYQSAWYVQYVDEYVDSLKKAYPEIEEEIRNLNAALYNAQNADDASAAYSDFCLAVAGRIQTLQTEAEGLNETLAGIQSEIGEIQEFGIDRLYTGNETTGSTTTSGTDTGAGDSKGAAETAERTLSAYSETLAQVVELDAALGNIATLQNETASEAERQAAALALQREGYGYLLGNEEAIAATQAMMLEQAQSLSGTYEEQRAALEGQKTALEEAFAAMEIDQDTFDSEMAKINAALAQTASSTVTAGKNMKNLSGETEDAGSEMDDLNKKIEQLDKKVKNTLNFREEIGNMKDLAREVKDSGGTWEDLSDEVKDFGRQMGVAEGDLDGTIFALENMESQTAMTASGMVSELQGILGTLEATRAELMSIPPAELDADASGLISEINFAISIVNGLLTLLGQAGIALEGVSGGGGRGGGGGSGGQSDAAAAQDAAAAANAAARKQEDAYRAELERIEHRRHMGKITAKEEIEELERVKRRYAKTAEQIMDIDERIYDARQELREDEQDKIDTLYDSIVEALEARYEEQREIEQQRISDSISAWEKWSDDTCAAIQKQIDALDEQVEAEDRAATEAEHLRRIASLEQSLMYETDAYNQTQLRKQIEQAQQAWADVQKGWAVEDQRKALEEQMQAVQDRADAEIETLEKESERIDAVYDEMLKGQSLAAEAQKLLMNSTQKDLLALLSSYAPDYEATGRTLGEKIYEGFQAAFGDITEWFEKIDTMFEEMTEKAQNVAFGTTTGMQQSGEASANVSSPTINQTVNINQPVESAADVARQMQRVNEELAGMI